MFQDNFASAYFFVALLILSLLAPSHAARADDWKAPLDAALQQAQARHATVLLQFHAPWCYSCYYMANNVLNGAEWQRAARGMVVVDIDVDAPEGAYWKERLAVRALPSYLVLDQQGAELGRIVGEQTRTDFYRQLGQFSARGETLDALRAEVRNGGKYSLQSTHQVLHAYYAREDAAGALAWLESLPPATRSAIQADAKAQGWTQRLRLLAAAQADDAPQCAALAPAVFALDLGCDRAYELDRAMRCTAKLPAAPRKAWLAPQKPAMAHLLTSQVFSGTPSCADVRSEVLTAADLDHALGYSSAAAALLDRAIDDTRRRLGAPAALDLRRDRNLADNLRVFLDRAGKTEPLDALYPQLIAAYPDDYVYPFRYAKSLAAHGRNAEALSYLQTAAAKAYGANRLEVAALQAQTLLKLDRADEARKVVADALKANGPWFPQQAAQLKAVVARN